MRDQGNEIAKRRPKPGFDFAIIIFIAIFIYIIVCIIMSLKSENIAGYQVKHGTLSDNRIYTGLALRDEHIVTSDYSGYVSFFISEGERASYNNLVYCIDETGKLSDLTGKDPTEDNSLDVSELNSLKQDIQLFSKNFDEKVFSVTSSFERKIENRISQIQNRRIIDNLSKISDSHSNDIIEYCRAKKPGIVLYYQDGYEDYLPSDLTKKDFDVEKYESQIVLNDDLVKTGDFVYKYVFSEDWSLILLVPNYEIDRILDMDYVEVKFSKTQTTSWAKVNIINQYEEDTMIQLSFTNSMINFCKDRFVEVELVLEEDTGLKIPNSSIAEKSFFLIDKNFVSVNEEENRFTVLRREFAQSGEILSMIVEVEVYKEDENEYYVDTTSLNYGDVLFRKDIGIVVSNDSDSTMVVGKQGSLIGVYSINKGYADFKRIEIMYANDKYSIIKPNAAFGLRAYDYIALDASLISDKDFVY